MPKRIVATKVDGQETVGLAKKRPAAITTLQMSALEIALKFIKTRPKRNESKRLFCVVCSSTLLHGFCAEINAFADGNGLWSVKSLLKPGVYIGTLKPNRIHKKDMLDAFDVIGTASNAQWLCSTEEFKNALKIRNIIDAQLHEMVNFNASSSEDM